MPVPELDKFDKLVALLWASFNRGVGDFTVDDAVYPHAWGRFYETCRANYESGVFDEPGGTETALGCCRACGGVSRALAQWGGRRVVYIDDFDPAATLIQQQSSGTGGVC